MPKQSHYYNSFYECMKALLNVTQEIKSFQTSFEAVPVNKPDKGLFTDIAYLKNEGKNPLVIITSVLLGIEGYMGSTLQFYLLKQICNEEIDIYEIDLLFVHAINPWEFINNLRVTKNKIGLNRNFSNTADLFQIKNPDFSKNRPILESDKKYSRCPLEKSSHLQSFSENALYK